jgi:hypothetical protein
LETSTGFDGSATFQISWPAPPKRAQQIDRAAIALRQGSAVADTRHLRAAGLEISLLAGMWNRYFGFDGSVTSTIEVPLNSAWPVSGLSGFGTSGVPP